MIISDELIRRGPAPAAFNRAFFDQRVEPEIAYALRHGTKVAILLFDLDGFKTINDTHGHPAGDQVLRAVIDEIHGTLRIEDLLARYWGRGVYNSRARSNEFSLDFAQSSQLVA